MAKLRKKENRQQVEFALHFRSWILILYHCGLICYREKENPLTLYETKKKPKETKKNNFPPISQTFYVIFYFILSLNNSYHS